jgi:hypothetical protein
VNSPKRLGIVQSRGIGDIIIALPIARHYYAQGYEIFWPICKEFLSHVKNHASWINWITVVQDSYGHFFYDSPMAELQSVGCTDIISLYQSLSGHPEFDQQPWYQITGFDQYKYHVANVPFLTKWQLDLCIQRDLSREHDLYKRIVKNPEYILYHVQGSNYRAPIDLTNVPQNWQQIEITDITDCIFDWLTVIEKAQAVICVDSVFANLIDQMQLTDKTDCYWIPRNHIHLTPVLGGQWTILPAPADSIAAKKIFQAESAKKSA